MNFKPETTTATITTISSLVKDILPKARLEDYAERYYIPESELDTLAVEVIAEPTVSAVVKVIEFWYGLKNYGTRYASYGMPESYLKFQHMEENFRLILAEHIDWDRMFDDMVITD